MQGMKPFRFWCQKVLPLVYEDSLSYYEVLCKVVKYINDLIESDKAIVEDIDELKAEVEVLQTWIDNFDDNAEEIIKSYIQKYISGAVIFGLTNDGYFCAYIPDSWTNITFDTVSNYDDPLYGHLMLMYD